MFKQKEVVRILDASNLPGSTKCQKLALAPKGLRQSLIKEGDKESEDVRISAAIEIQRQVRGYKVRCGVYEIKEPNTSKTALYSDSKHEIQRLGDVENVLDHINVDADSLQFEEPPSEEKLQLLFDEYIQKMRDEGYSPDNLPSFTDFRTAFLQTWESKKVDQKEKEEDQLRIQETGVDSHGSISDNPSQRFQQYHQKSSYKELTPHSRERTPNTTPQTSLMVVKKKREGPLGETEACVCIQRAWRRHIDIQVYRYYRDLINFKTRGDPSLMLRCINPNESKLLDPASGIHVRFRLAGERFPPNIYYKIFTHRPIVDMCANSPKDYTRPEAKKTKAKDTHTKDRAPEDPFPSKEGWYQRIENNGWRLVSDRLIHHIMSDPVTWTTSKKKYEFHHDKLTRKQDVEKRRKQKKINWMQKMYKDGMLKAKADDYETVKLIEGAAAGMVATVEAAGPEALEEWEVDELLDWTTSLNFDDYLTSWKDIATSSHSEKKIADRLRIMTNNMDPFEFSLSTGPSRFESTRQSHNTPVSSSSGTKIHIHVNS